MYTCNNNRTILIKLVQLKKNYDLLDTLMNDQSKAHSLYKPGIYWQESTKRSVREIRLEGLSEFRSSSSNIGTSYADNFIIDRRISLKYASFYKRFIYSILYKFPRFSFMQDSQVLLTKKFLESYKDMRSMYANANPRIINLLSKFSIDFNTLRFGCDDTVCIKGVTYSHIYLEMLSRIDFLSNFCDFSQAKSFVEIGGGFGSFAHLILELFPNIQNYYLVDISPNLYVANSYLKSFFGESVYDYMSIKSMSELPFADDNSRRIYCLPPWQIKKIPKLSIDLFHNASSFVEMPKISVENYASIIEKFLSKSGQILLQSYDNFNLDNTFHPDNLPSYFRRFKFKSLRNSQLFKPSVRDYYYISEKI